jgi:hypothetical protein
MPPVLLAQLLTSGKSLRQIAAIDHPGTVQHFGDVRVTRQTPFRIPTHKEHRLREIRLHTVKKLEVIIIARRIP